MRKYIIPAAVGVSLLAVAPALSSGPKGHRVDVPRDQWLPLAEIASKFTELGYTVTEIEAEDGVYEVEMVDKNGVRGEVYVHPVTAEILPDDDDDDDDDDYDDD